VREGNPKFATDGTLLRTRSKNGFGSKQTESKKSRRGKNQTGGKDKRKAEFFATIPRPTSILRRGREKETAAICARKKKWPVQEGPNKGSFFSRQEDWKGRG